MNKKFILAILCPISYSISIIAQTSFYYYKGEKIPLFVNDGKICISIPKNKEIVSNSSLLKDIHVLNKISDENFETSIIQQSDFKKLSASISLKEKTEPVLLSSCYKTMEGKELFSTPYLKVRLKKEQDIDLLSAYAEKYKFSVVKQSSSMPLWYILSVSSETGKNSIDVANELWESGMFAASVPDLAAGDILCSNDPMFTSQWGLHNNDFTGIDVSASSAWNYSTGKDVKIAVLDSGVDLDQIDLSPNISSLSYDTETKSSPSVVYGEHGTHCAGIAAAVKDNGIQIAGVAPEATIMSVSNGLDYTFSSIDKLADGIIWAYKNGADIISNSWYYSSYDLEIEEAIREALKYGRNGKGCIVVFASGNEGMDYLVYPSNCNDSILTVGAIEETGKRADFSSYGKELDIVAPGVNILSTYPNNQVEYLDGTSMACPHAAGVAALILERNSELTVDQVNSIIKRNAKKVPGINFDVTKPDGTWNIEYGHGLVDAYNSVMNTPSIAYVQNETTTGSRIISADSIYIGRNVTDTKEYGNVIWAQGDVKIKAKKYVEIKNSTTIPLGTKLKIVNQ